MKRDAPSAAEHIDLSLRRLNTGYIDLFQFHQVALEKDWEKIMAPGGAMEAVLEAQKAGKIRFIGITSHSLSMAKKYVESGLFVSIQFPFNFIETDAAKELHPLAREKGVAILAMKPFAGGPSPTRPWPSSTSAPTGTSSPSPGTTRRNRWSRSSAFYGKPNEVTGDDLAAMEAVRNELGGQFCRRCEYCQPCPQGVSITQGMIYPLLGEPHVTRGGL